MFSALNVSAEISNKIIATVGDKAITSYELEQEMNLLNVTNGGAFTNEKKNVVQRISVQSLIRRLIKKTELENYPEIEIDDSSLNNEVKNLETKLNIQENDLKNIFTKINLPYEILIDEFKTNLKWNVLIYQLYKNKIYIDENIINEKLKKISSKKFINKYLLSEIFLNTIDENSLNNEISIIMKRIEEEGFESVALDISQSESAKNKGALGWFEDNAISKQVLEKIKLTKVGSISSPIMTPAGIILMKVVDKKKVENKIDLTKAKEKLISIERNKKFNMYSMLHYQKLRNSALIKIQ